MEAASRSVCLHDRDRIEAFLRRDTFLNIYGLGDLDEPFWSHTSWHGLVRGAETEAIALLYSGLSLPCLLVLGETRPHNELLRSISPLLPRRFACHLSPGLAPALERDYRLVSHGEHLKMGLTDSSRLEAVDTSRVVPLGMAQVKDLMAFYDRSYPGHWFEPRMLETGYYFGLREAGSLVSVAGIHVYSRHYRVAALGNIATHPEHRRRGLSKTVVARLCQELLRTADHIGLNVKSDNAAAIACYRGLGFRVTARYEEIAAEGAD